MPQVAVIGAGLIGRAWATIFARAGWDATLYDQTPGVAANAWTLVADGLRELADAGLADDPEHASQRVTVTASLEEALHGASFVQENAPEPVEDKQALFAELDRLAAPDAILASSTSAIVASRFTEALEGRARCLVAHPVN